MRRPILVLLPLLLALPGIAQATNGYFTHGTSIKEKALAGTGVAYSQDTLAAANNPAGMVFQGGGYDIGASVFNPNRSYSAQGISLPAGSAVPPPPNPPPFSVGDGDQSIDSGSELFLIPQFGYNWVLSDAATIGVSVFGHGGMNTDYNGGVATLPSPGGTMVELPGTFGDGTAGVDLAQLFVSTTYARKFSKTASWGASLILAYQQFEAKGLGNFAPFSTDPSKLSNNGKDAGTGFGVRLGIQGEVASGLTLGAALQPEIDMSEFDDYSGLFAEKGDFDIPSNYTVGLAWDVTDSGTLLFDVQQINYSDVPAVSNPIAPLVNGSCSPTSSSGCLGGSSGAGFGWQDMTVVKLGYQWRASEDWTWRFGYSQGDQPIPESEVLFNILAPGVMEQHVTAGFTKLLGGGELNFAFMVAPSNSVSGKNTFDPNQTIKLEMDQLEISLGYGRRF
ncbi:MAG: outer membrane protein transport protein [Gammaproteobacteria bacterium]|nr:outer membrane protein transport protein [Gammaproteobacteria bacterium]